MTSFWAVLVIILGFMVSLSQSYKFYVGGKDGWILTPSEDYNHWAERNRFQVNDTLFFRYGKGENSVLVVKKDDYFSCNTSAPLESFAGGNSTFKFDRSGPFFFISGDADKCKKGLKLVVVVLALNHRRHPRAPSQQPALAPSPSASLPVPYPDSDVPARAPAASKSSAGSVGLNGGLGMVGGATIVMLGSFFVMV